MHVVNLLAAVTLAAAPFTLDDPVFNTAWQDAQSYEAAPLLYYEGDVSKATGKNDSFPFAVPAGRESREFAKTFRYPRNVKAKKVGVVNGNASWDWPVGTVYFELHDHPTHKLPFELRARVKVRDDGPLADRWEANIFRPVYDHADLEKRLGRNVAYSIESREVVHDDLTVRAKVAKLGEVPSEALISPMWYSVHGTNWVEDAINVTSDSDASIVPREYAGWLASVSCTNCHDKAGKEGVRGGDMVFTDHTFHEPSTSLNGLWWNDGRVDEYLPGQEPVGYNSYYRTRSRVRLFRR